MKQSFSFILANELISIGMEFLIKWKKAYNFQMLHKATT